MDVLWNSPQAYKQNICEETVPVKYVKAIRKVLKSSTWAVLNESLSRKCQKNRKTQALRVRVYVGTAKYGLFLTKWTVLLEAWQCQWGINNE